MLSREELLVLYKEKGDSAQTVVNNLITEYTVYNEEVSTKYKKQISYFWIAAVLLTISYVILLQINSINTHNKLSFSSIFIIAIFIFIIILCTWPKPKLKIINKNEAMITLIRDDMIEIFVNDFDVDATSIKYDIHNILTSKNKSKFNLQTIVNQQRHYNPVTRRWNTTKETKIIEYFWLDFNQVYLLYNILYDKYYKKIINKQKEKLQLKKLELQNESIAIDNEQKRFWTCNFCGNMNRADDMSCIKCGGIRPSGE